MSIAADQTHAATSREPFGLLDGVREVADAAHAYEPMLVTQRAWDCARRRLAGYENLPPARRIAERSTCPGATPSSLRSSRRACAAKRSPPASALTSSSG